MITSMGGKHHLNMSRKKENVAFGAPCAVKFKTIKMKEKELVIYISFIIRKRNIIITVFAISFFHDILEELLSSVSFLSPTLSVLRTK